MGTQPLRQLRSEAGGCCASNGRSGNRFRLFRNEADFLRQVAATRGEGVLAAERRLARETDGRGWARDVVERVCVDRSGNVFETCERDGERKSYLAPRDHRIGVAIAGTIPSNEGCLWNFNDGDGPAKALTAACNEEIKVRVRYGRSTLVSVDVVLTDGTAQRLVNEIQVRDVLVAGLGDSIAAGEGNPDRAVRLSDEGFCFRRLGGYEYFDQGGPALAEINPARRSAAAMAGGMTGRGRVRAGSAVLVIARCTAIRRAPHSRWR